MRSSHVRDACCRSCLPAYSLPSSIQLHNIHPAEAPPCTLCLPPLQIPAATEAQQTGYGAVAAAAGCVCGTAALRTAACAPCCPLCATCFAHGSRQYSFQRRPTGYWHPCLQTAPSLRPPSLPRSYNIKRNEFEPEWDFEAETIISELADFK